MAKVLIVDDDPDIVEASRLFLARDGHEVIVAASRTEGMTAVGKHKPDLLVLDVMMEQPDDGIAMAQDLRRGGFAGPILMLTSLSKVAGFQYDKDADVLPVNEFVQKPIEPADLVGKVRKLLGAPKRATGGARHAGQ